MFLYKSTIEFKGGSVMYSLRKIKSQAAKKISAGRVAWKGSDVGWSQKGNTGPSFDAFSDNLELYIYLYMTIIDMDIYG